MLPNYNDGLQNDFKIVKMPSKTYYFDSKKQRISGFIDGVEAVRQAVYFILSTERFRHEIYSHNYGVEAVQLIGCPVEVYNSRIEKIFTDAVRQDDRVKSVSNFSFERKKNQLFVNFVVETEAGELSVDKTVIL